MASGIIALITKLLPLQMIGGMFGGRGRGGFSINRLINMVIQLSMPPIVTGGPRS